jgi:hypothetical protein
VRQAKGQRPAGNGGVLTPHDRSPERAKIISESWWARHSAEGSRVELQEQ